MFVIRVNLILDLREIKKLVRVVKELGTMGFLDGW
jgi:hypothetical protein